MNREDLKNIFKILITILLVIVAVKFFIALLPLILVALLIYFVYDFYRKNKSKFNENTNSSNARKTIKKGHVQEAEIVREKTED